MVTREESWCVCSFQQVTASLVITDILQSCSIKIVLFQSFKMTLGKTKRERPFKIMRKRSQGCKSKVPMWTLTLHYMFCFWLVEPVSPEWWTMSRWVFNSITAQGHWREILPMPLLHICLTCICVKKQKQTWAWMWTFTGSEESEECLNLTGSLGWVVLIRRNKVILWNALHNSWPATLLPLSKENVNLLQYQHEVQRTLS